MVNVAKISPSCIKDYLQYRNGKACGRWFRYRWIDRLEVKEVKTDAQLYGYRFEYLVTGELPYRCIDVPDVIRTPGGARAKMNDFLEDQVSLCKKTLKRDGFEILETSPIMQTVLGNYRLKQVNDIYAQKNGINCFIDLKTSGFLYNKWEDYGWDEEKLPQRRGLLIQPAVAKILGQECLHVEDVPFYFYIGSNKNSEDAEFFKIVFSKRALAEYLDLIEDVGNSIFFEMDLGFTPTPSYQECRKCIYNDVCELNISAPKIKKIHIL